MNPSNTEPTVIGIASGKGGVGKSTVAVNLGFAFANLGKKTVVLDADLGLANAQILMGLHAPYDIGDILSGKRAVKDVLVHQDSKLALVPGSSGNASLANISPIAASSLINTVRSELDNMDAVSYTHLTLPTKRIV